jgi:hypothetical protein
MNQMGKNKEKKKNNEVKVIDETPPEAENSAEAAKAALAALSEEERAAVLKELGITTRKPREKKDTGPSPSELFKAAQEKLYNKMPAIQGIVDECEFPSSFAVTVGVDPEGLFFASLKRVRNKYGPRKSDDS